jgi:hypothetical protein
VPLTEDVTAFPADATCATVEEIGPVAVATVPVSALLVEATWLSAEDTTLSAEDSTLLAEETELETVDVAELATAEVVGWLADATCPAADWTVPAVPDVTLPTVCVPCVAADVAADAVDVAVDTVDVAAEAVGAPVDAVVLAAGALDAVESASVETVDCPVETAWLTAEDRPAVTEVVLAAAPPEGPFWAVVAPGLVAAEADFAVRRDRPMATPMAARAMPAAHRQNRRTLVTSPLVTTVTLIRSG